MNNSGSDDTSQQGDSTLSTNLILEDVAEKYIKTLVDRKFIKVTQSKFTGRPKKCQLVGVVHDAMKLKLVHWGYFYFQ